MKVFIITGTSRGIGEQLAKILLDQSYTVHGIARGNSERLAEYSNYHHHSYDLSDTAHIEQLISDIFVEIGFKPVEMIGLINNAALLEPLKPIDKCTANEITNHIQVTLVAPMVLTSCFIKQTSNMSCRRKVLNISSGSGIYPAPDMSVYSAAKAGLNMFTQCVGAEQEKRENPIEILAITPGMVETEMQLLARSKNDEQFEMAGYFKDAYHSGRLQTTEAIGLHLLRLIEMEIDTGKLVNYDFSM